MSQTKSVRQKMMNLNDQGRTVRESFENFPTESENSESSPAIETGTFEYSVVDLANDVGGINVLAIFVSPFVTRHSMSLKKLQGFILVLTKLKINVCYQDLACRFEASISTV